jgi:hypothetical protein
VRELDVEVFIKKTGGKCFGPCPGVPEDLNNREHPPVTITVYKKKHNQFKVVAKNHSNNLNHKKSAVPVY